MDAVATVKSHNVNRRERVAQCLRERWAKGLGGRVATLAAGSALGQGIAIAFSPVVTRLYGPAAFGAASVFAAVVAVVGGCATLAYAYSIALPRRRMMAYHLFRLSLGIGLFVSVASAVVLAIGWDTIASTLGLELGQGTLVLLPLAVMLASVVQTLENLLIRLEQFFVLARTSVLQSAFSGCARTVGGLLGPSAYLLVFLSVVTQCLQAALLFWSAHDWISKLRTKSKKTPERARVVMISVANRYRDFPLYRAPQLLLNFVSRSAPVIVLAGLFGAEVAGFFALAQTVVYLPFSIVGQSIGQVLLQRYSTAMHNGGQLRGTVRRMTGILLAVGIVPFSALAVTGPWLFGMVFGVDWADAGYFARWLTVWVYLHLVNLPAVQALVVGRSQGTLLAWEVVTTATKLLLLVVVGTQTGSALVTVAVYSLFGAAAYVVLILLGIAKAPNHDRN